MSEKDQQIDELKRRIDRLVATQVDFQKEVIYLRSEIEKLDKPSNQAPSPVVEPKIVPPKIKPEWPQPRLEPIDTQRREQPPKEQQPPLGNYRVKDNKQSIIDIERFIGENLLSKIGIVVLILGVGIGLKYAIDSGWITPVMRVSFAYLIAALLAAFALKFKEKYLTLSSVLVSGAISIGYFTTYFAYSEYGLLPQIIAFALMTVCTVFAVATAILYSRQIIAHIGLVGAYAVPFLLSNGSGNYGFLFSYIALVNIGILAICVYKYWKPLFYTSFILTWIIYLAWLGGRFEHELHREMAFVFLGVFFFTFQIIFIIYKTRADEEFAFENITLVASNSVLLFSLGTYILSDQENARATIAIYSLINAVIHLIFAFVVNQLDKGKKQLDSIFIVLVLTFASLAIAIKFDGNTRTILFALEAVFLFTIGRMRGLVLFEYYSYLLSAATVYSLLWDWQSFNNKQGLRFNEISRSDSNSILLTGLFTAVCFSAIFFVNQIKKYASSADDIYKLVKYTSLFLITFITYNAFRLEIDTYFHNIIAVVLASLPDSSTMTISMKSILWQFNYTIFFVGILWVLNKAFSKDFYLTGAISLLQALFVIVFVVFGQIMLFGLRTNAQQNELSLSSYFSIRYVAVALVLTTMLFLYNASRSKIWDETVRDLLPKVFDVFAAICLLLIVNGEVLLWTDQLGIKESYKFALSILWGGYALLLVVIGMLQDKKYFRFMAFGLFGITLVKLFLYDTSELGTIEKTLLFMLTGVLLLVGAYLYNRFAKTVFNAEVNGSELK